MNVAEGRIVRIDCELRVKGGEIIESSSKTGPVEYRHGQGQILRALESQLEGMAVGEEKSGVIPAAEAFGTEDSAPRMTVPRSSFPSDAKIEIGAQFEAKSPTGTPVKLEVLEVKDDTITAKVVHPLAGKDIEYRVKILSVRPPPPPVPKVEEIELEEAEIES